MTKSKSSKRVYTFREDLIEGGLGGRFYLSRDEQNIVYRVDQIINKGDEHNTPLVVRASYSFSGDYVRDATIRPLVQCFADVRLENFKPRNRSSH